MLRYEKPDYSHMCTMNDNTDPHCLKCRYFIFPIGCVFYEVNQPVVDERDAK